MYIYIYIYIYIYLTLNHKSDVIFYFESYVLAIWSVLVGVSVFRIPSN